MPIQRSEIIAAMALVVSAGALMNTYRQGEASRIEASRPRITVEQPILTMDHNDRGAVNFQVKITAKNIGPSPARSVHITAKLFDTDAPRYALAKFTESSFCTVLAPVAATNLYPTRDVSIYFILSSYNGETLYNPERSYVSGEMRYMNQQPGPYIVGCVSYGMDGVKEPFIEPLFYRVDVKCGPRKTTCRLSDQKGDDDLPVDVNLEDPL